MSIAACTKGSMLQKSADKQAPPAESVNIAHFGCEVQDGNPIPVEAIGDPAPSELVDEMQYCDMQL